MSELAWARPASAARTLPTVAWTPFMMQAVNDSISVAKCSLVLCNTIEKSKWKS